MTLLTVESVEGVTMLRSVLRKQLLRRVVVYLITAGVFLLIYVAATAWLDKFLAWVDAHLFIQLGRDVVGTLRQAGAVGVAGTVSSWVLVWGLRRAKPKAAAPTVDGSHDPRVSDPPVRVIPRQLPPAPQRFAGREAELAVLTEALDTAADSGSTVVISAVDGAGGMGKTSLSVRWARQHIDRFPDGQLFVDLRGFAPSGQPMPVIEAVRGFLQALGQDPNTMPADLGSQIGLYRSLVAGRRMLIVLDNARDIEQVTPLLPGDPCSTVLVTSRRRLAGLVTRYGARLVELVPLGVGEARELLEGHIGSARTAAEPDAVSALLESCGGFPLALDIVAARAIAHPAVPLSALAAELQDRTTRLDALNAGEIPLRLESVFSWSYQALTAPAAEMFGLLGLAPGPDISMPSAAALAGLTPDEAAPVLRELEMASLVKQQVYGRYRIHDLLRLYAGRQATTQMSTDMRDAALHRLIEFLRRMAYGAERLLDPHRHPIQFDPAAPDGRPIPLRSQAEAETWLEAEHSTLLAAQQSAAELGLHEAVWQLAWSLDTFHYRRGYLDEWRTMWELGLASAKSIGDPAVISLAYRLLGDASFNLDNYAEALPLLNSALSVAESSADLLAQAHAHRILTWALGRAGDNQAALGHAREALRLYQELQLGIREAAMLNAVGRFEARLGHYEPALVHCEAALRQCREHGYTLGEAHTIATLGYVDQHTGRPDEALARYEKALGMYQGLNSAFYVAETLDLMGQVYATTARPEHARAAWTRAAQIYREKRRLNDATRLERELDDLGPPPDAPGPADVTPGSPDLPRTGAGAATV
jgi:tetratricopeptide (TPR) repeat protein